MTDQYAVLSRALPFVLYILLLALGDQLSVFFTLLGINEKWLYVLRISILFLVLIYFRHAYSELLKKPKAHEAFVAFIVGVLVLCVWILPYPEWATLGVKDKNLSFINDAGQFENVVWISIRLMGSAMVIPVMEELFWRSFLMRWIDSKDFMGMSPLRISSYALFLSAGLFALEHHLWFAGMIAGLAYGLLYKRYQNLWIPIAAHAVTNGLLGAWVIATQSWQYW